MIAPNIQLNIVDAYNITSIIYDSGRTDAIRVITEYSDIKKSNVSVIDKGNEFDFFERRGKQFYKLTPPVIAEKYTNNAFKKMRVAEQVFQSYAKQFEQISDMASANFAFKMAFECVHGPWFVLEPYLLKDPKKALAYALKYSVNRWPELESIIVDKPFMSSLYACNVMSERFIEAEEYIMKSPSEAVYYAKRFFREGWADAEPYILTDLKQSCKYAINFKNKNWPDAEQKFKDNDEQWSFYNKAVYEGNAELLNDDNYISEST